MTSWLRLALLAALVFLIRWLWRAWQRSWHHHIPPLSGEGRERGVRRGTVRRDPFCGTYVDVNLSVRIVTEAETLHFCSERCRDAYLARAGEVGRSASFH